MPKRRTAEEIRRDIDGERRRLDAATRMLVTDARRTARLAAIVAVAGVATLALARFVSARRRRRR